MTASNDAPSAAEPPAAPTLAQALQQWTGALRVLLGRLFSIAVLETRLAALSFVLILIIGVASGLLLASAWIALFASVVGIFHNMGLSWPMALLLMAVINFLLAAAGGFAIYRMSNNLLFRTLRQFILATEIDDGPGTAAADVRQNQPAQ